MKRRKTNSAKYGRRNSSGDTSTDVRSPTSTEVRSPTKTSTEAYTQGNFTATVTGGAGAGATTSVTIKPNRGRRDAFAICKRTRGNPSRWNPLVPLDPISVLSAIEGQREKIAKKLFTKNAKKARKNRFGKKRVVLHMKRGKSGKFAQRKNRGNPVMAAEKRYQSFHGRPSEDLVNVRTTLHSHDVLAGIGDLRKLKIKSANGHWKVTVKFLKPYPILSMNEAATQLYIEGGDQSVDLRDFGIKTPHEKEILGHVTDVWYFTTKDHLRPEDGGTAIYHHKFGKIKPTMIYDVPNQLLEFAGGGYTIPDEGIDQ
jgi:hypothetical protein